jgi:hypothetical protein
MKKKQKEGWLMASALLGLPKLISLMKRERVPLLEAEEALRREAAGALVVLNAANVAAYRKIPNPIPWAQLQAKPNEEMVCWIGIKLPFLEYAAIKKRSPKTFTLEAQINLPGRPTKIKKVEVPILADGQSLEARLLYSWLTDELGEPGQKLLIATAPAESNHPEKKRRLRHLERDSAAIARALDLLDKHPRKVRAAAKRGQTEGPLGLAALSVRCSDYQDELKSLWQEIGHWESEIRKATEELERYQDAAQKLREEGLGPISGKSGKKKRG